MKAKLQSYISDFLHKRGVTGGESFAIEAASAVADVGGTAGWSQQNIRDLLRKVRTDVFRRNPQVRKAELLDELAAKVFKHASPPLSVETSKNETCTVLLLSANPVTTERLQIDEEIRSILQKAAALQYGDHLKIEMGLAVRPDDILQRLNDVNPHVLHFSGHGSQTDGIALSGESGTVRFLTDRAIDRLFAAMKGRIRLVVLNACFSEVQAKQIVKRIDCVVGMRTSITDKAATVFAGSLYRALAFGRSVKNAYDQAIAAIAMEGLDEDDTPVLLTRDGVSADRVILVKPLSSPV